MKLKPINQQVVVVMGASSGIGRETALLLAKKGAKVVCAARSEAGLKSVVEEIHRAGGEAIYQTCDVAEFSQVEKVAAKAAQKYGRIDTWVHLAAVSVYAPFEETTPKEFKRILDVNLLGQIHGALAALPHLRREGQGALIHISSVEAKVTLPFQAAYAASKHGMVGFLESLQLELGREGVPISVTNLMPAAINTPFFENALSKLGVEPKPPRPIYQPIVVARAILQAAQHPMRNLVAGGSGVALLALQRLSPTLTAAILGSRIGFEGQRSLRAKCESPGNLFAPLPEAHYRTEGEWSLIARRTSVVTRLETSRMARGVGRVGHLAANAVARLLDAIRTLAMRPVTPSLAPAGHRGARARKAQARKM